MKHFIKYTIILLAGLTSSLGGAQTGEKNIRTGYPVYHIAANADGSNLYFYNKLNAHNIGFYAYKPSDGTTTHIAVDAAIGDIIYNPFQDQFLVSKFEPGSAEIEIFDAGTNVPLANPLILTGVEFVKEMYISPDGRLYVCAGMNLSSGHNPSIFVYDANDYTAISNQEVTGFNTYNVPSAYYQAYFDYNAYDKSVFISMSVQDLKLSPYNSQASRIYNFIDDANPVPPPPGKVLVVKNNIENEINLSHFPGKVICPDMEGGNESSQYYGKLFIAGEQFYMYDYLTHPPPDEESDLLVVPPDPDDSYYFLNMVYSPYHDKLFAIKEVYPDLECMEHKSFEIWTINYDESLQFNQVEFTGQQYEGQIASMFYNPYDRRIYVYQKIDAEKLGTEEVKLLSFDPALENPAWSETLLGITSYFPDYDHTRDLSHYWYYNMTKPYINPYTNKIYLPNGGHSCVSKVPFVAREPLALRPAKKKDNNDNYVSLTWLSFPRMDRTIGNGDEIPVNFVLGGDNIIPNSYYIGSELQNLPLEGEEVLSNTYDGSSWETGPSIDLPYIFSELGYKLQLDYGNEDPPGKKWLLLTGTVLDPDVPVIVYPEHENWEGYWLYQSQSPFDAIPDEVLDQLIYMEAQNWACMKRTGSYKDNQQPTWICSVHTGIGQIGKVSLDYGDMVILESSASETIEFEWQGYGSPPEGQIKPDVEYYQFEEQSDYTAFFIELDSTENPQEIAAFIGDSCVGATTVLPDDTTALVPGYIEGMEGDVTFEEYYGSEKTAKPPIRSYLVNDLNTGNWELRTIRSGERKGHYLISFGKQAENTYPDNAATAFRIWPNPASGSLFYSFLLEDDAFVNISIFDISGKRVANPVDEPMPAGSLTGELSLTDFSGGKLKPGVYLVKAKLGDSLLIRKVIVN
ncbi:MAG: T9SS type A sorting domain-containing protein [Bacteroidales bacterium]|nr:T9SS type A sorting domain-containing protein [Bacteroidales bacterium]